MEERRTKMDKSERKIDSILKLNPSDEFVFQGSEKNSDGKLTCATTLYIENKTDKYIAFKIKTTRPKCYSVKPNSGCLDPRANQTIEITLHSFDKFKEENSKHKFQVQAIPLAEPVQSAALSSLWKASSATELFEAKLKCKWVNVTLPTGETFDSQHASSKPGLDTVPESPTTPASKESSDTPVKSRQTTQRRQDKSKATAVPPFEKPMKPATAPASTPAKPSSHSTTLKQSPPTAQKTTSSAIAEPSVTTPGTLNPILILVAFILGILFDRFILGN